MKISACKQRKYNNMINVGVFLAFMTLSAIIFSFFSPIVRTSASTELTSELSATATVNPVASIVLDSNEVSFDITPTSSGVFSYKPITATVNTNSTGGYELYFSSTDEATDMTNIDTNIADVITSNFADTVTSSTMPVNSWGYSLGSTNFSKIPLASAPTKIKDLSEYPDPDSYSDIHTTLNIGMKINDAIAAGTYSKTVKFSVIAHESVAPFEGITRMQDMTPEACAAASTGETATLRDIRDGNTYTVKKLADGKCWMTENLRLIDKTISSTDSNLPSGETYTVPASDLSSFTDSYNTNSAYLDSTYGGYYNFYTATAGWGTNSVKSGNSPKDICPKGWRLPTGVSSGEFQALYNQYNSSALMQGDPGFILSGYVYLGSVSYQGSYGHYWSSSVNSANNAYRLYLNSSNVYPANYGSKYLGFSVRCVAKEATPTMQTFDKSTLANVGDSISLEDARDGNIYTVKKLKDGNVWMTENLRLIDKTISSTDSNLPSGETYTVPASDLSSFTTAYNTSAAYVDSTYGGYYNFYTATAGFGTNSVSSGNSNKSICPKGWRLPTGGSSGEFKALYNQYNSSALMQGDPGFILSGNVYNGSVYYQGSYGFYWSSSVLDANYAYYLYLSSSNVNPAYDYRKYYGFSVRCMAI